MNLNSESWKPKALRAEVIAQHVATARCPGVVCFSCGNASRALRQALADRHYDCALVEIGPRGSLSPNLWWEPAEIARAWPGFFDGTSGHLPGPLMMQIADAFRENLTLPPGDPYVVPCGSGETLVCLAVAFPYVDFVARYDGSRPETTFNPRAPLNALVRRLALHVEGA